MMLSQEAHYTCNSHIEGPRARVGTSIGLLLDYTEPSTE
jgi:hypothetical protein